MKVQIATLNMQCSLQLRNFRSHGMAMSDCCGKPAAYAVEMENKSKMWRCFEHRYFRRVEIGTTTALIDKTDDI